MSASALKNFAHEDENTTSQSWKMYEESLDYEVASEIITMMISRCSRDLWKEEHKPNQDAERMAQIDAEMSRLWDERNNLHVDNYANIKAVIKKYGPILKADYDAQS